MPSDLVLLRETKIFGEHSDVENPVLAYVLCGQRHALKDPNMELGKMVALAASNKLPLLKGVVIERAVEKGTTLLRMMIPAEKHKILRGAWYHGNSEAMKMRLADATQPTPNVLELKKLTEKGGLAAQAEVYAKWRKES